jgi:hypothetical protein
MLASCKPEARQVGDGPYQHLVMDLALLLVRHFNRRWYIARHGRNGENMACTTYGLQEGSMAQDVVARR